MHGRIRVELVDQRVEFAFRRRCRHAVFERDDPGLAALGDLAADIDLAGGIVTDQHHGEPGGVPVSATICRTSSAVRSVSARAMALPSMIWAICHLPLRTGTACRNFVRPEPASINCMCCIQNLRNIRTGEPQTKKGPTSCPVGP
jgi:hypothetical protein